MSKEEIKSAIREIQNENEENRQLGGLGAVLFVGLLALCALYFFVLAGLYLLLHVVPVYLAFLVCRYGYRQTNRTPFKLTAVGLFLVALGAALYVYYPTTERLLRHNLGRLERFDKIITGKAPLIESVPKPYTQAPVAPPPAPATSLNEVGEGGCV